MIPHVLEAIALILGVVAVIESQGRSFVAWGVIALAVALLYGILT